MGRRLRIAVITSLFPTAAEPYRAAAIWSTLRELKVYADLDVYCPLAKYPAGLRPKDFRYHPQPADTREYSVAAQTVEYSAIPLLSRMFNGYSIYRSVRRAMAAKKPDLILGYYIYPEGYAALRLGQELNIPVVVSARGSDLRKVDASPGVQRKTAEAVKRSAAVLCVSTDLANIAQNFGAPAARVHTVRNGIDSSVFRFIEQSEARRDLGIPAGERLVLFVGWLSALKGTPQLIEAVHMLNRSHGPWRLALVGEGKLETNLRQMIVKLGIEDRVQFLGSLGAPQIATWLNSSDLLCLPSESEGCPNVIVEALSCGTPVVATNVGGIPELVDERCGVLISSNRPDAIAEGLRKAFSMPWNRAGISASHSRSWSRVAEETYRIFETIRLNPRVSTLESAYGIGA
jgi:teichuronic acid biosynthesis glycosyltransferase TuaC